MTIVFFDQVTGNRVIEDSIKKFKIAKINYRGRLKKCYICTLEYWTKTYPCNQYDLLEVRENG